MILVETFFFFFENLTTLEVTLSQKGIRSRLWHADDFCHLTPVYIFLHASQNHLVYSFLLLSSSWFYTQKQFQRAHTDQFPITDEMSVPRSICQKMAPQRKTRQKKDLFLFLFCIFYCWKTIERCTISSFLHFISKHEKVVR